MFAMLAAFGAEARTGTPLFVQIQQTPVAIAAAFATIIIASVIPVIRGANLNRDGAGPFTQARATCALAVFVLGFHLSTSGRSLFPRVLPCCTAMCT